jgi:calcineurin-like phosphoesterase family protein
MSVFFTSDPHYGHHNIIEYSKRPFTDVDDMRRVLMQKWNDRVGPRDLVYVLGDFTMGKPDFAKRVLGGLNGEKHLIIGNHDRSAAKMIEAGFASVNKEMEYQLGPYLVDMSHYPYCNDMKELGYEDKFAARRPKDRGRWLLHGHCHIAWKVRGRQVNVGVDVWDYAPVSQEELIAFIKEQP